MSIYQLFLMDIIYFANHQKQQLANFLKEFFEIILIIYFSNKLFEVYAGIKHGDLCLGKMNH